jgi:hypothetical protein
MQYPPLWNAYWGIYQSSFLSRLTLEDSAGCVPVVKSIGNKKKKIFKFFVPTVNSKPYDIVERKK